MKEDIHYNENTQLGIIVVIITIIVIFIAVIIIIIFFLLCLSSLFIDINNFRIGGSLIGSFDTYHKNLKISRQEWEENPDAVVNIKSF